MLHASRLLASDVAALLLLPLGMLAGGAVLWPAACLVAIGAAVKRRHLAMLVWYGLAVGFDAQAWLVGPVFAALMIQRRVPPALVAVAPLLALALPGIRALGAPLAPEPSLPHGLTLAGGAPTLWSVVHTLPWVGELPLIGLALTAAIGTSAAYIAWFSARPLSGRMLRDAALLCALVVPGLMPAIGSDAFLLAGALAMLLAVEASDASRWRIAILVVGGIGIADLRPDFAPLGALALLSATLLHARAVLKPAANDNPLMARTARTRPAA